MTATEIKSYFAERRNAWPMWALIAVLVKVDGDAGVGDTIARVIGPIGGDAYRAWRASLGRPCRCKERQEQLNKRYPYK